MTRAAASTPPDFDRNVFVNCPFDATYQPLFRAIVFTVQDAGFGARCALELIDGGDVRVEKIVRIIGKCRFGIHDISRTELDAAHGLPRFNMPFELGLDLGARRFGAAHLKQKVQLVLDRDQFRYQKFLSDIAGQDVAAHHDSAAGIVRLVRNWLRTVTKRHDMPGERKIDARRLVFERELPALCHDAGLDPANIPFADLTNLIIR